MVKMATNPTKTAYKFIKAYLNLSKFITVLLVRTKLTKLKIKWILNKTSPKCKIYENPNKRRQAIPNAYKQIKYMKVRLR
jgi:hypothetical protein